MANANHALARAPLRAPFLGLRRKISAPTPAPADIRVLVVGGDACQQRFCETFLATMGIAVDLAAGAEEGLTALKRAVYGLVIVDNRTRGFDAEAWSRVIAGAARGGVSADLYVVTDDEDERASGRVMRRPLRAIHLLRAVERLPR